MKRNLFAQIVYQWRQNFNFHFKFKCSTSEVFPFQLSMKKSGFFIRKPRFLVGLGFDKLFLATVLGVGAAYYTWLPLFNEKHLKEKNLISPKVQEPESQTSR